MRPFLIGIGGAKSGIGKTEAACNILRSIDGLGAIKCTKTAIYSSVIDDPYILGQKDKDTSRFIEAGARAVLWVQSTSEDMPETLEMAVDRLAYLDGLLIEGNSAIEVLKPDIVIFILGDGASSLKRGAERTLDMADAVVYKGEKGAMDCVLLEKPLFDIEDTAGYVKLIKEALDERHTDRKD